MQDNKLQYWSDVILIVGIVLFIFALLLEALTLHCEETRGERMMKCAHCNKEMNILTDTIYYCLKNEIKKAYCSYRHYLKGMRLYHEKERSEVIKVLKEKYDCTIIDKGEKK